MNTKLLILSTLAAMIGFMTSCSDDESLTSTSDVKNTNTIAFSLPKQKGTEITSRSGITQKTLSDFYVTSVNEDNSIYFDAEQFTYDMGKGIFMSQTPHYWPTTGTLSFYAINFTGTKNTVANNAPKYTYTNWSGEKDLIAATVMAGEKTIPYPLTFKHILSQVSVSAEAKDKAESLTYKLISVNMTAPSTGTYSFASETGGTGTWVITNSQKSRYDFDNALPMTCNQDGKIEPTSTYWNILPTTDGPITFDIEYQVIQNGRVVADCTGENKKVCEVKTPNLSMGKKYRYNFLLTRSTEDVITFTTTLVDWADGETTTFDHATSFGIKDVDPFEVGENATMEITDITPSYSYVESVTWYVDDPDIATINAQTGLMTGVSEGTVHVTAISNNGIEAHKDVHILKATIGMENGHQWVDLGLPSGKRWATDCVGANSKADYGEYYMWGDTEKKSDYFQNSYCWYTWGNYTEDTCWYGYNKYTWDDGTKSGIWYDANGNFIGDGKTKLDPEDDVARKIWQGNWRMPKPSEYQELIDNCDISYSGSSIIFKSRVNKRSLSMMTSGHKYSYTTKKPGLAPVVTTSVSGLGNVGEWATDEAYTSADGKGANLCTVKIFYVDNRSFTRACKISYINRFYGVCVRAILD